MAADKQKKEKGAMAFIIVVLLLTLVGAGTGLAVGSLLQSDSVTASPDDTGESPIESASAGNAEKPAAGDHGGDHGAPAEHASADGTNDALEEEEVEAEPDPGTMKAVPFPPVLTTLAEPKGKWIRVEGSILVSTESHDPPELLAERSGEQILSYLRTLRLDQIEGPSGMLGLREDLNEMIKVLSKGEAKGVLIHGLIVE